MRVIGAFTLLEPPSCQSLSSGWDLRILSGKRPFDGDDRMKVVDQQLDLANHRTVVLVEIR